MGLNREGGLERKGTPIVFLPLKKVTSLTHLLNKNKLLAIFVYEIKMI